MQQSTFQPPVLKDLSDDPCVKRWLSKYGSVATRKDFAYCLHRFLRWLVEGKGIKLTPSELITQNLRNVHESKATEVFKKREHTDWLGEYVSLQGPLKDKSNGYRKTMAAAVRSFYARNDSPLFGDFDVPLNNYEESLTKQISIEDAKKCISLLPLRSKVACVCLLLSGMRITEFLNLRYESIQQDFESGRGLLKVNLVTDRGRRYFTYIGKDGIEHLRLYLDYRRKLTGKPIMPRDYIFINDIYANEVETGKPLIKDSIQKQILRSLIAKGVIKRNDSDRWRSEFHPHALRHLFKTECAHVGINPVISEFWMGHNRGIEYVYNHQHELHEEDFLQAYKKVEPHISISSTVKHEEEIQELRQRLAEYEAQMRRIARLSDEEIVAVRQLITNKKGLS